MKDSAPRNLRLRFGVAALLAVGLTTLALAQQSPIQNGSFVSDWSSQRLIFSNPGTEQEARAHGTYDDWLRVVNNPRYVLQQLQRHAPAQGPAAEYVATLEKAAQANASAAGEKPALPPNGNFGKDKMKKDWSEGILGGAVLPNAFPATFAVNYGQPNCAGDYVLYPVGSAGALGTAATVVAYHNLYDTTCTGTVPQVYWAYNTGAGYTVTTSPVISPDGTKIAFVQSGSGGMQLVVVKWSAPTLTSDKNFTSCSYVSANDGFSCISGLTNALIGYNLTSNLPGIPAGDTVTSTFDGTLGTMSLDATATENGATMTVHAAAPGYPITPTVATNITTCTAPCMTVTNITTNGNTFSSPYYDIASDTLYVGDDASHLYKASAVFSGTANPFIRSATLNPTAYYVASPVYDNVSGCVLVGDSLGYLYEVNSGIIGSICTTNIFGLKLKSALLGQSTAPQLQGIFDAPLVDSTQRTIYAFVAYSATISNCYMGNECLAQFKTNFGNGAGPADGIGVGVGAVGVLWYDGAFDNVYYSSTNGTGNLYFVDCQAGGCQGGGEDGSDLDQEGISQNTFSSFNFIGQVAGFGILDWVSPITEFCNNGPNACVVSGGQTTQGNDYLFFSAFAYVDTSSGGGACSGANVTGCAMSWLVSNPNNVSSSPEADVGLNFPEGYSCYGTGAFVIDNASTAIGASNVYFVNMNGNTAAGDFGNVCSVENGNTVQAVQASQSEL